MPSTSPCPLLQNGSEKTAAPGSPQPSRGRQKALPMVSPRMGGLEEQPVIPQEEVAGRPVWEIAITAVHTAGPQGLVPGLLTQRCPAWVMGCSGVESALGWRELLGEAPRQARRKGW